MAERSISLLPSTVFHFIAAPTSADYYLMAWPSGRESIPEDAVERARTASKLDNGMSVVNRPRLCSIYFRPPLSREEALRFSTELTLFLGHVADIQTVQLLQAGHPSRLLETVTIGEIGQAMDEDLPVAA